MTVRNLFLLTLFVSVASAADRPNVVWLVSEDNSTHYLKLFDEHGDVIAMFFGERKPGRPELPAWRQLAHEVSTGEPQLEAVA